MTIQRHFPNILSENIEKTQSFFCSLLDFKVEYKSDWFIHLKNPETQGLELGILPLDSNIIPEQVRSQCSGTMLTYTVPDVEGLFLKAKELKLEVIEEPTDLFYGQRRLLLRDSASGVLVDISSECEPSKEFLDSFQ